MGAGNAGKGGSDGYNGPDAGFVNTGPSKLSKKNQELVDSSFEDRGAVKIKNSKFKTPATMILTKPLQSGSKVTRNFFTDKVLGSKNFKGTSKSDFLDMSISQQESIYGDYIGGRQSGKTDAYGNTTNNQGGDGGNNTPTVITKNIGGSTIQTTAPTEAEVSQSEAANADAAALKIKKKGRSQSIISGSQGVTKTSTDYSLGKKSLLGRV